MSKETIGLLSGAIVIVSVIPYAIRVYQRKIHPNVTTWCLWTIIGLALLLTYRSSGASANVWPAVFGFTNPLIVAGLIIWKKNDWEPLSTVERVCLAVGLLSLVLWLWLRNDREMVQFALYLAIIADACAAIPTAVFVWTKPMEERPFAWGLYAIGYGIGIFAITEHTVANYALPVYMFIGASSIALPLVIHRIRYRMRLAEWL
ncbi:MAG: hypothetical protein AAB490_00605 [Patescibacteria group bacterium]